MPAFTYTRKPITQRVRILAHFTIGDQFIGFSGSSVSGSSHHTISSDGAVSVVGVGMAEDESGLGEGVMLYDSGTPVTRSLPQGTESDESLHNQQRQHTREDKVYESQ